MLLIEIINDNKKKTNTLLITLIYKKLVIYKDYCIFKSIQL